ncbi:MAG: stage III sporulation protein AB [Clostridia bacterium]|jgi:stage III sporulation protein AB|nr:stage III sporulation protein AB [Clostridia bacterium]
MLKLLGAVLVVFACGSLGRLVAMGLNARKQELRAFRYAISALETEIAYGLNPLPQALLRASEEAGGGVGKLLGQTSAALSVSTGENAAQIWQHKLQKNITKLPLASEDFALLHKFGMGLGESDGEDQLRRLKLLNLELKAREDKAAEMAAQMGKIWQSLGWGTGIILALLWL